MLKTLYFSGSERTEYVWMCYILVINFTGNIKKKECTKSFKYILEIEFIHTHTSVYIYGPRLHYTVSHVSRCSK